MAGQERKIPDGAILQIKKDKFICPITGKEPSDARCQGQFDKRMLSYGKPCDKYEDGLHVCYPKWDDLTLRR